jgi:methylglutaconyl-CoA hydratase
MAIGTHDAAFSLSEVRLGLIPAVISPYVIAAIGERAAHRYFLTAERFDAAEGYRLGLLSELAPNEDEMDARIEELIAAILAGGPVAIHRAKELIAAVANRPLNDDLKLDSAKRIARTRVSDEGQEGLKAFLDKRKPGWVGSKTS